jgi:hypothetical protein
LLRKPSDLIRLNIMEHLLRDMRIILILPNDRPRTVSEEDALRPRFIRFADSDMSDVGAVLEVGRYRSPADRGVKSR